MHERPNDGFRPVDPDSLGVSNNHADIDPDRPSPARIYNYWLGGKDNFAADRKAGDEGERAMPQIRRVARQNRAFMVRVVRTLTAAGIDQFIDLGSGVPASPNVHEVARERIPTATVVYVDNDPIVLAHNRALRETHGVRTINADLADPESVLTQPDLTEVIDLGRPVGLLGIAVMHFVADSSVIARYVRHLTSGSYVALSVGSSVGMSAKQRAAAEAVYRESTPMNLRGRDEVAALFDGLELAEPGLVNLAQWRPTRTPTPPNCPLWASPAWHGSPDPSVHAGHRRGQPVRTGMTLREETVMTDTAIQREVAEYRQGEDRPLGTYLGTLSAYGVLAGGMYGLAKLTGRKLPRRVRAGDLFLMACTTHKLARLIAKDPVLSPLRMPFTRFEGVSGPAELSEDVRGHGLRHGIGELLTCPFCMAQWVATAYAGGLVFAPRATRLFGAVMTAVASADWLQLAYARLQQAAEG